MEGSKWDATHLFLFVLKIISFTVIIGAWRRLANFIQPSSCFVSFCQLGTSYDGKWIVLDKQWYTC